MFHRPRGHDPKGDYLVVSDELVLTLLLWICGQDRLLLSLAGNIMVL